MTLLRDWVEGTDAERYKRAKSATKSERVGPIRSTFKTTVWEKVWLENVDPTIHAFLTSLLLCLRRAVRPMTFFTIPVSATNIVGAVSVLWLVHKRDYTTWPVTITGLQQPFGAL